VQVPVRRSAVEADDGFTLMELLVVIVVLGIVAGIVTFGVGRFRGTAEVSACKTDVRTVLGASAAREAREGAPAPDIETLVAEHYLKAAPESGVTYSNGVTNPPTVAGCGSGGELAFTPDEPVLVLTTALGTTERSASTNNWRSRLAFTVLDGDGAPVEGARVEGVWSDGATQRCDTGSNGGCVVPSSPHSSPSPPSPEVWTLSSVTKEGYDEGEHAITTITCTRSTAPAGETFCTNG
jgi:prepilin-type N-terminal cleavage/methylation domain-containing protein